MNYERAVKNTRKELENYVSKNRLKSIVVGVSGGIDSALVCALAYPVAKKLNVELIGRSITIESNKPDEIKRANEIGNHFCTNFKEINLTNEFLKLKESMSDNSDIVIPIKETETEEKIRLGNVKARMRMIHLYDLAQKNKGFGLSTDNYTELMVGFWTLHGDVFDYGLIQELWKTEVYEMTEWIANNENLSEDASNSLKSMLDATATDGLGISNSDLDQLIPDWKERHKTSREGYTEVDSVLKKYFYDDDYESIEDHPIVKRHLRTEFKRQNPTNLHRSVYFE